MGLPRKFNSGTPDKYLSLSLSANADAHDDKDVAGGHSQSQKRT